MGRSRGTGRRYVYGWFMLMHDRNQYNIVKQLSSDEKFCCCSVTQSRPSLWTPWPFPGVCSNSCPLNQWCHPTISSSVIPFSSCLQSFPTSGSFSISQLFASGGQRIGVSASASVLPMNISDWFSLGWTDCITLLSKGLSRVFSSTTVWKHQFFGSQPFPCLALTSKHDYWKNHSFDDKDLVGKIMSLPFNTLSRFAIAFLPRNKCLLISWLQSPSTVIL